MDHESVTDKRSFQDGESLKIKGNGLLKAANNAGDTDHSSLYCTEYVVGERE